MDDRLLEPLKFYEEIGRETHAENIKAHFDDLLLRSGVNEEENRATVKSYKSELAAIEKLARRIGKYKVLRVLLIIGIILGGIMSLGGIVAAVSSGLPGILLLAVGALMLVGSILLLVKKVNPTIKQVESVRAERAAKADELLREAWAQMAPLNALFDDSDTLRLIEKTIPDISFDQRYTTEHERLLVERHDFVDLNGAETSIVGTLAGRCAGNPFLFCRRISHRMGVATYHGSLVISWTETYRDSSGKIRTRTRTQTLHASVTKPKPEYHLGCYLGYGSQAAPDLTFSRKPTHAEDLSEKALQKKIRSGEKRLKKKTQQATREGSSFQEMANTEFDVLFGAEDRDHEIQFRLMFTPPAQRNTVALIKSQTGYGDDFFFDKRRRFNIITSEHAQHWDADTSASRYHSYDIDTTRATFTTFNEAYFKSVFFDFAPLLSIPAYVEEPCASLDPIDDMPSNYTYYEHEVMANAIGMGAFVHRDSATDAILKTAVVEKRGKTDVVAVTANSYATQPRIDFVPVMGGDGRLHPVPVPWTEYIPVSKTTDMEIEAVDMTATEFRNAKNDPSRSLPEGIFCHGMVARTILNL